MREADKLPGWQQQRLEEAQADRKTSIEGHTGRRPGRQKEMLPYEGPVPRRTS